MTIYHFVGIKGSGMSALAQILHDMNFQVQGSDVEKRFFTQNALKQAGIKILPFQKENIRPGMTIIAGNAFPDTHEEIQEAMKLGFPIVRYHRFLGDFMKRFSSIAVTGHMEKHLQLDCLPMLWKELNRMLSLLAMVQVKGMRGPIFCI